MVIVACLVFVRMNTQPLINFRAITRVPQLCGGTYSGENVSPPFPEKEEEKQPHTTNKENVPQAPVFSGQLQNCVFNFYNN